MKSSKFLLHGLAVAVLAVTGLSARADGINLVQNSDFSPTPGTFPGYTSPVGPNSVSPWLSSNGYEGGTAYGNGFYNHDFQAAHPTAGFLQGTGSLTQTLNLTAGQLYTFSFMYEDRAGYAATDLSASIGGVNFLTNAVIDPNTGFTTFSGTFTALSATEDLVFSSFVPTGADGASVVTNVNVIAATPEPSSLALLGTGMLGMVGVIRRRMNSK